MGSFYSISNQQLAASDVERAIVSGGVTQRDGTAQQKAASFVKDRSMWSGGATSNQQSAELLDIKDNVVVGLRGNQGGNQSGVRTIIIPAGVEAIQDRVFFMCSTMTSITLPDTLSRLGVSAFSECSGLTSLTLPDGLTRVEARTCSYCHSLTSLSLPDSLVSVGSGAFLYCTGLTSLTLPHALTDFGNLAFGCCERVTSVVFRPPMPGVTPAFVAWAVGRSRNRANWHLTTLKRMRNVLGLITALTIEATRGMDTIDPNEERHVFYCCTGLGYHTLPTDFKSIIPCYK